MNISEISIRRPVFAWMLMAALLLFGTIGFRRMGISSLPDIDFPVKRDFVPIQPLQVIENERREKDCLPRGAHERTRESIESDS
jgi:hypothetical protein